MRETRGRGGNKENRGEEESRERRVKREEIEEWIPLPRGLHIST